MSSDFHFLEPYLMRDVIRDMVLKDILIRKVKPDRSRKRRKWHKNHFGREM